jgi:hypothetical protein
LSVVPSLFDGVSQPKNPVDWQALDAYTYVSIFQFGSARTATKSGRFFASSLYTFQAEETMHFPPCAATVSTCIAKMSQNLSEWNDWNFVSITLFLREKCSTSVPTMYSSLWWVEDLVGSALSLRRSRELCEQNSQPTGSSNLKSVGPSNHQACSLRCLVCHVDCQYMQRYRGR